MKTSFVNKGFWLLLAAALGITMVGCFEAIYEIILAKATYESILSMVEPSVVSQ